MDQEDIREDFSPEQSFGLIQTMIETAKNQFSENGHLYLVWGWTVFSCSLAQFILFSFVHYEKHYLVWLVIWIVFIYQFFYLRKKKKRERVKTYTDHIIGFVWLVFVILMFLFAFILGNILGSDLPKILSPVFLTLYGMPTFLSGIILRLRALIIGGIGCWLLAIGSTYASFEYRWLFISTAMVIAWIIPGYLLKSKYKKINPDHGRESIIRK